MFKDPQLKASLPILVTDFGILRCLTELQPMKAPWQIDVIEVGMGRCSSLDNGVHTIVDDGPHTESAASSLE